MGETERVRASRKRYKWPDQVKRRHVAVPGNVEHLLHHGFSHIVGAGVIDRCVVGEACDGQSLPYPQAVKLHPGIFPGEVLVGDIGVDLIGKDHKALSAFDLIYMGVSRCVVCIQHTRTGYNIVEQVMIAGGGAKSMGRLAAFPAELI